MKETLCWRCKRPGTNSCPWDASCGNVPVDGWTAKKVPYRCGKERRETTTYHVVACPLFVEDESYDERMEAVRSGGISEDRMKIMEHRFRCDWPINRIAFEFGLNEGTVKNYKKKWRENGGKNYKEVRRDERILEGAERTRAGANGV